jgi:hypothetical protein
MSSMELFFKLQKIQFLNFEKIHKIPECVL